MWLGLNGKRTIGQQGGVRDGHGNCNATAIGEYVDSSERCYGWALHDKPVVLPSSQMATGLTAVVHLEMGVVNRIQWDSSCNLCPNRDDADSADGAAASQLSCVPDNTNVSCVGGAACRDCYAQLSSDCSGASAVCAPKVYLAWLGTDRSGRPLLSAGSVLSRFAAHSVSSVTRSLVNEVEALANGLLPPAPSPPSSSPSNSSARQLAEVNSEGHAVVVEGA